jgi:hypothetical protein
MKHIFAAGSAAALIALLVAPATADVAPDPSDCTVAANQAAYGTCQECRTSELDGGTCAEHFTGTDLGYVCNNDVDGYEVWCSGPTENEPSGNGNSSDGGCTVATPARSASLAVLLSAAALAAAAWLGRRRPRT